MIINGELNRQKELERYSFALMDRDNSEEVYSSVAALPSVAVINGTSVASKARYDARNIVITNGSPSGWTTSIGENLTISTRPGGRITYLNSSALIDDYPSAMGIPEIDHDVFRSPTSACADITTGDFIFNMLIRTPTVFPATTRYIQHKRAGSPIVGYQITWMSGGFIAVTLYGGAGGTIYLTGVSIGGDILNQLIFLTIIADRTGLVRLIINGTSKTLSAGPINGYTMSNSSLFSLNNLAGQPGTDAQILHYQLFEGTDTWLDSDDQTDYHMDLMRQIAGIYPSIYKGTKVPSVHSRASSAITSNYNSSGKPPTMFLVGNNWIAGERIKDNAGNIQEGLRLRPEATNIYLQSNDYSSGKTAVGITTPAETYQTLSGLKTQACVVVEDTNTNYHSFSNTANPILTSGINYTLAIPVKYFDAQYAGVRVGSGTVDFDIFSFDLLKRRYSGKVFSTGTSAHTLVKADLIKDEFGWDILYVTFLSGATTFYGGFAGVNSANTNHYYLGTSRKWYTDGCFLVAGVEPRIIPTTTTAVVQLADQLYYKGDDGNIGNQEGVIELTTWVPFTSNRGCLISLNDGGSANDEIKLELNSSNKIVATMTESGFPITLTSSSTFYAGQKLDISYAWRDGEHKLFVNGMFEADGIISSFDIPDDLDRIQPGYCAASIYFGSVISNIRISPYFF